MKPLYIFDLDGTLALNEHRQHHLEDKKDPDRWRKFFAACSDDLPNMPVITTLHRLMLTSEIWIWSGRSDEVRQETIRWIVGHTLLMSHDVKLWMREKGDHTPDEVLKGQWFDEMSPEDKRRLVAVFDDRDKVVAMWRSKGIACFQVAPGSF